MVGTVETIGAEAIVEVGEGVREAEEGAGVAEVEINDQAGRR